MQYTLPPTAPLKSVVYLFSNRLGIQILYDNELSNKNISIVASKPIPVDSLLDILESALKINGLALVDADVKGWKRIVAVKSVNDIAQPGNKKPLGEIAGTKAITQTFSLTHLTPKKVDAIIKPFLTGTAGASTIIIEGQSILIVTDYASNLVRIAKLIEIIDRAGPAREVKFLAVKYVEASALVTQITNTISQRTPAAVLVPVQVTADTRTNQLMIVGTLPQIEEVLKLAKSLDVTLNQRTQVYSFQYVAAERVDKLVKQLIDPMTIKRLYRSALDKDDNLLIATGNEAIHEKITWLKKEMDVKTKRPGSSVKFYRLKYADAQSVLATLQSVVQQPHARNSSFRRGVSSLGRGRIGTARSLGPRESPIENVPGPNNLGTPGEPAPTQPGYRDDSTQPVQEQANNEGAISNTQGSGLQGTGGTIIPGEARVTVDANSNTIIVIADRNVQQVYSELIKILDRKRPQVMIEAKVVILDTSDDFTLGVEVSQGDGVGAKRLLQFTSYGLSGVDDVTGALSLIPGRGFNWTLVDPNSADAVIRAISGHRRAKVLSSPRILVNDNATGTLSSVNEVPFASLNVSNTVNTTSFAGFAEAGTTIEVTPRITDGSHLELEYSVTLNNFTGAGGDGIPPPRQTDEISSDVNIPDGYTIIVGGLTRQNWAEDRSGVPFLDTIPIIRDLTGTQSHSKSQTTMFVFLKAVILRDDKFRDLKYLSDKALPKATEPGNYPKSGPLLVR